MGTITASDVAKLRSVTLAGMMDCKKALEESNGDFDKAIEIIRKRDSLWQAKELTNPLPKGLYLQKQRPTINSEH